MVACPSKSVHPDDREALRGLVITHSWGGPFGHGPGWPGVEAIDLV